ncbi:hypothetical protein WISP_00478 [Willisornis vidua]|uniref:Uncharacterized protein n=1 Tax=Willisornis vidua TaxID=1566151 RepID=A0ABQ9DW60_9PASS|nr:hypothetical protein WISP_00478 [Willisornis vidua]
MEISIWWVYIPSVAAQTGLNAVLWFLQNSQKVDRLDGAHAPELSRKVQRHVSGTAVPAAPGAGTKEDLNVRLQKLINAAPCMLFMKGSPKEPRCGEQSCSWSLAPVR